MFFCFRSPENMVRELKLAFSMLCSHHAGLVFMPNFPKTYGRGSGLGATTHLISVVADKTGHAL